MQKLIIVLFYLITFKFFRVKRIPQIGPLRDVFSILW